jgi:hypothetical protein
VAEDFGHMDMLDEKKECGPAKCGICVQATKEASPSEFRAWTGRQVGLFMRTMLYNDKDARKEFETRIPTIRLKMEKK